MEQIDFWPGCGCVRGRTVATALRRLAASWPERRGLWLVGERGAPDAALDARLLREMGQRRLPAATSGTRTSTALDDAY